MSKLPVILFLLSKFMLLGFIFIIVVISIPDTSVTFSNFKNQIHLRRIIPEGWAFFTRNPRETDYEYFEVKNGALRSNSTFPFAISTNSFGLNRTPKLINSELFMILNQLDSVNLKTVEGCTKSALAKMEWEFYKVKNPSKSQLLKDSICVILYKPIPWAWAKTMTQKENIAQYVFLDIE